METREQYNARKRREWRERVQRERAEGRCTGCSAKAGGRWLQCVACRRPKAAADAARRKSRKEVVA